MRHAKQNSALLVLAATLIAITYGIYRTNDTEQAPAEATTRRGPSNREIVVDQSSLATAEQLTILLTTHYLEEADRLAERVAIVSRGKVIVEGAPEALKRDLRGELVTVDLGSAAGNGAAGVVEALPGIDEVLTEGQRLFARVDQGAQAVPVILGALYDAGFAVAAVTVSRPSLDDVYLRHAGRAFHAANAEGQEVAA